MAETWEEAVLYVLSKKGTVMSLREIYRSMEDHPLVTHFHREYSSSQERYKDWIRSRLANLKRQGCVEHVGRGLYRSNYSVFDMKSGERLH